MKFNVEKKISNFIESQFPQFYLDEGAKFVDFVKAYYEWMENEGSQLVKAGPINQSRNLFDFRDIDNTLDSFLEHFQAKYLYGIPFKTISDPRMLLKNILDVYRSKGSIQCYKLLFRLLYNEDCEIYLPSLDVLRVSDGLWVQPKYLEVIDTENIQSYLGKVIYGASSKTIAVVENIVKQPVNKNIVVMMYISNISPRGGQFKPGEKIVINKDLSQESLANATSVIGSLDHLKIINGGQNFRPGDILKLAQLDPTTNEVITNGVGGEVKVLDTFRGQGALTYFITNHGGGYFKNSNVRVYNDDDDGSGYGGTFKLGPLHYAKKVTYNTDLIMDHLYFDNNDPITLDSAAFQWSKNPTANISSTIQSVLSFSTNTFGSVYTLTEINPGNNYIRAPHIFVETSMQSNPIPGNVYYKNTSKYVHGTNTNITSSAYFQNNRPIFLQANSSNAATAEFQTVKQSPLLVNIIANTAGVNAAANVINIVAANSKFNVYDELYYAVPEGNTQIGGLTKNQKYYVTWTNSSSIAISDTKYGTNADLTEARTTEVGEVHTLTNFNTLQLWSAPYGNSTATAQYRFPAPIFPASYAIYEQPMRRLDNTVNGLNLNIIGQPSNGNDIVSVAVAYNSGKGYRDGEVVTGYLFNCMNEPVIVDGGLNYSNNDSIVFYGGGAASDAAGFVTVTDNYGTITEIVLNYTGSGYTSLPYVKVKSARGTGAVLKPSITASNTYNTYSKITGQVIKNGVGVKPGNWITTSGFLNSDKYIQDSSFYQDFSYQIRTALQLEQYRDILYNTFHVAGSELFGEFYKTTYEVGNPMSILYEQTAAAFEPGIMKTTESLPISAGNKTTPLSELE